MNRPLILPYPPLANRLWRTHGRVTYKTPEAKQFAFTAHLLAKQWWGRHPSDSEFEVEMFVYRPRKSGDIDGPIKATLDCLNGVVWDDDKQVVGLKVWRFDDKINPRVELKAWERQ